MNAQEVRHRVLELGPRDARRLGRRLDAAVRRPVQQRGDAVAAVAQEVDRALERLAARAAGIPALRYPAQLPVVAQREQIVAALRDHQVIILAGETGSGKTTQLPKMCLEAGRGVKGMIGHTQPRRIAARSVAERIAEELGSPLGEAVGYKVRFTDAVSERTYVKLMTDGVLLAEVQNDRLLTAYDTIIIDEAHERSLNIDFLLGYLRQLLPRRPDLKVVITSATIETQRFSDHFGGAPVLEVSGRTFPVQVRYRPLVAQAGDDGDDDGDHGGDHGGRDAPGAGAAGRGAGRRPGGGGGGDTEAPGEPRDQVSAIVDAVAELAAEGPGDVLVFLSGEREIRDTADALSAALGDGTEVLPLYARLSAADQHRVFAAHQGRRIVLATNVAETSLTVPGIRYVVDPGTARISRYSARTKVQRLPIEPISQASARQRAGRCGRVQDGICVRLYSEPDFLSRPQFTDPEVLRTNLASVVLQMASLGLGEVEDFPFVEPPDRRNVRDGVQLLEELGAFSRDGSLTPLGRRLAQLPVDPRLGRMLLEAHGKGCLREVLVLVSALSIQDPRERPVDKQHKADELHARFRDPASDFVTWLNLWRYVREQQRELSSSAFRRMCARELLSWLRIREWQDLHGQLRRICASLDLVEGERSDAVDATSVHQALLAGLLSHVGLRDPDKRDYVGARGARFVLGSGSVLSRRPPRLVMVGELVETSRLFGRTAAAVEPEWAERAGEHLVKRTYSEPHWERQRAAVVALERVTLYGVPLVVGRRTGYATVDPVASRELFLRHALVEGDWDTRHHFFAHNRRLLGDVEALEDKARRRDIRVDDETVYAFYDERVPADVVSGRHFDAWWKKQRHVTPDLLTLTLDILARDVVDPAAYPDVWTSESVALPLDYAYEPGTAHDGVTVTVPLAQLNQVDPDALSWGVPGMRQDLVVALLKSLPKALRVAFVPVPDTARAVLPQVSPSDGPLLPVLTQALRRRTGVVVPPDAWDWTRVPDHLRPTYQVVGTDGRVLGADKDLAALRASLAPQLQRAVSSAAGSLERSGLVQWDVGTVPRTVTTGGVQGFPALVDERESVALRVLAAEREQQRMHPAGVRRLLLLTCPPQNRLLAQRLTNPQKLALSRAPHGSVAALLQDCVLAAVDALAPEPVWDEQTFAAVRERVREGLHEQAYAVLLRVEQVLAVAGPLSAALDAERRPALQPSVQDMRRQLDALVRPGLAVDVGARRLPDLLRWLQGVERRLQKLPGDPERDRREMAVVHEVEREVAALPDVPGARQVREMVQELRVSLFAQPLRTAYPVSEKRVYRALDELVG